VATLLPRLSVDLKAPLDLANLFGDDREIWLEVGFGAGEHLLAQAKAHPGIGFIGVEPYLNGMASLLDGLEAKCLTNVRLLMGDARDLLDVLGPASLGRAFLLFPDPWPKKRHYKRRFVARPTLDRLALALKDGAEFRVATDMDAYCAWTLAHLTDHPAFDWCAEAPEDWRVRPDDWPPTRYEQKARRAGRQCVYLTFRRKTRKKERIYFWQGTGYRRGS